MRLFKSERATKLAVQSLVTLSFACSAVLVSGVAAAAGDTKDKGGGATAPAAGGGDSPGGGKEVNLTETRDRATDTSITNKIWEIGAGVEYHHTGLDGEYINNEANRNVNYYSVYARVDPSPYDRISASFGVYQYFLADQGESGVRADDVTLKYTHRIPLPGAVTLRLSAAFNLPVSYGSQLAGIYTAPKFQIQADRRFGRYFSLDARVTGGFFLVKSAEGGAAYNAGGNSGFGVSGVGENGGGAFANPKGSFTMGLNADLAMPFHEPLSIGLSLYTGYTWYYDVSNGGGCPANTASTPCMYGSTMQPTSQPFEQSYGGEVYIRYALPSLGGFKLDLTAAYAPDGDPTLGYASVLAGNGVAHVYPFYSRENAEVYFAINGKY